MKQNLNSVTSFMLERNLANSIVDSLYTTVTVEVGMLNVTDEKTELSCKQKKRIVSTNDYHEHS